MSYVGICDKCGLSCNFALCEMCWNRVCGENEKRNKPTKKVERNNRITIPSNLSEIEILKQALFQYNIRHPSLTTKLHSDLLIKLELIIMENNEKDEEKQ